MSGQLDNTQLTLSDLSKIAESFITTLRGSYHPRIEYPKTENASAIQKRPDHTARRKQIVIHIEINPSLQTDPCTGYP